MIELSENLLFGNLEFTRLNKLASFIEEPVDVDTPVKLCEVNCGLVWNIALLKHFPAYKIIDLN